MVTLILPCRLRHLTSISIHWSSAGCDPVRLDLIDSVQECLRNVPDSHVKSPQHIFTLSLGLMTLCGIENNTPGSWYERANGRLHTVTTTSGCSFTCDAVTGNAGHETPPVVEPSLYALQFLSHCESHVFFFYFSKAFNTVQPALRRNKLLDNMQVDAPRLNRSCTICEAEEHRPAHSGE